MRVFVISSVRNASPVLRSRLEEYSAHLTENGHEVYLPHRDTRQDVSSLQIVVQNRKSIEAADEVHLFYCPDSQGSHFELGLAFAMNKRVKVIENVEYPEGKSFARMVDEWQASSD